MKPKVRRQRRNSRGNLRKIRCITCHKKRNKFHKCSGKTKEQKRAEK